MWKSPTRLWFLEGLISGGRDYIVDLVAVTSKFLDFKQMCVQPFLVSVTGEKKINTKPLKRYGNEPRIQFMFGIHHPIFWGIYFFPKGSFQPLQELILGPSSGCRRRWPNWVGKWGPGWSWNLVDFWQMVVWSWKVKAGIRIFLFPPIPQVSFFL